MGVRLPSLHIVKTQLSSKLWKRRGHGPKTDRSAKEDKKDDDEKNWGSRRPSTCVNTTGNASKAQGCNAHKLCSISFSLWHFVTCDRNARDLRKSCPTPSSDYNPHRDASTNFIKNTAYQIRLRSTLDFIYADARLAWRSQQAHFWRTRFLFS